jgi:outer membrane protein
MKNRVSMFLMLLLVAGVSQAELKIGYVNINKVMEKAPQTAKAKSRLESEFSSRVKVLDSQIKEIKTLEEKLGRDGAVMSEDERHRQEKDIIDKKRDAQRSQQEYNEDFSMRQHEELNNLQKRMLEAVKALAKEESYDLLLTDVLYADEKLEVTSRIQQKMETLSQ